MSTLWTQGGEMCVRKKTEKLAMDVRRSESAKLQTSYSDLRSQTQVVLRMAAMSRILVLSLIVIWRSIASPYDTSASLNPPCLSADMDRVFSAEEPTKGVGHIAGNAIEASVVWDGVYYVRIAQCGYEYEQTYAFLPFLPLCMRFLSKTVFAALIPKLGQRAVLALSGYVLNNIAFVLAAIYLYKLTTLVLNDPKLALRATALFCFNPASIFYSSIYSESLFSLLSFAGMYHLTSGANWKAMVLFAMSSFVRSNGVINAGFFLFQAMHQACESIFQQNQIWLAVQVLIVAFLRSVCVFAPFFIFQLYGFLNICHGGPSSEGSRPWCTANVPYLYGFLQSHYWQVGFLQYFQLKQLPNFLLASPVLLLGTCLIFGYAKQCSRLLFSLGFRASYVEKKAAAVFYFLGSERISNEAPLLPEELPNPSTSFLPFKGMLLRHRVQKNNCGDKQSASGHAQSNAETIGLQMNQGFFSTSTTPFVLQLVFMVTVAFFIMHVQVATRFLSVSPPIYWFASHVMEYSPNGFKLGYLIWVAFLSYMFFGSLLFANFYPFT